MVGFACLRSPSLAFCSTKGRGLTFTSARTLVRALVDEPGLQPNDMRDHTKCVVRALMPTLAVSPPHVCHRRGTGLSPLARTCNKTWQFLWRLHILAHFFRCSDCSPQKTTMQKIWRSLTLRRGRPRCALERVFYAPVGAGGTGLTAWVV